MHLLLTQSDALQRSAAYRQHRAALLSCVLLMPAVAAAEPMAQGEARIQSRADVRLSLRSAPGTTAEELQPLAQGLQRTVTPIQTCYGALAEDKPTLEGAIRVEVRAAGGGKAGQRLHFELLENTTADKKLARCVTAELTRVRVALPSGQKAAARVRFSFRNTAARGVQRSAQKQASRKSASVKVDEGGLSAKGGTGDGRVRYRVTAKETDKSAAMSALDEALQGAVPYFLDCRRKAGKRSSPEGQLDFRLQVKGNGRVRPTQKNSTVADGRATGCVKRALTTLRVDKGTPLDATLHILFAPIGPQ